MTYAVVMLDHGRRGGVIANPQGGPAYFETLEAADTYAAEVTGQMAAYLSRNPHIAYGVARVTQP